jgi:hypothetical protein
VKTDCVFDSKRLSAVDSGRGHRIETARRLMASFAERTGLGSQGVSTRYLWTDAFAVCNFLSLARVAESQSQTDLALKLADRVHHVLGRHRPDDVRAGWISGLSEEEGEAHPTRGGLRIGKKFRERRAGERFDELLEWERDGQYFHYLTKWMHALDQLARATGEPRFNFWARELLQTAHGAFTRVRGVGDQPRMAWKMSIDLSRPLVGSMGQHDALDGYVTCLELQKTASDLANSPQGPDLKSELSGFASMLGAGNLVTADPLGLGGLLMDACRLAQLVGLNGALSDDGLPTLLEATLRGLRHYAGQREFEQPASRRLAFRELGLTIGLQGLDIVRTTIELEPGRFGRRAELDNLLDALAAYASLGPGLESFWLDKENRQTRLWSEHRDINEVMLVTSLVPEGFLSLKAPSPEA